METADKTTGTASPVDAETNECTTRDLIEQLQGDVDKARLEKELADQRVSSLEEHLKQLEGYDTKIDAAVDAYGKGIGAVAADLGALRTAVEQSKTLFECLVPQETRTEIAKTLKTLRERRETLKACVWTLNRDILDKQCKLDQRKAEVTRENDELEVTLARLDLRKAELADLTDLKESIDCSDGISNACRYGYYLDLVERLKAETPDAKAYKCDLVDQVKKLDKARQHVTESENELSVARDLLARVTKLRDDLVGGWRAELCRAITAGAVVPLPADIQKACTGKGSATTAAEPTKPTGGAAAAPAEQPQQSGKEPECGDRPSPCDTPEQAEGT